MKPYLKIICLFCLILSIASKGFSQAYYKFNSYELANIDDSGNRYNIKKFSGTMLFDFLRIDPHYSIECKYTNKEGTYKTLWDNNSVDNHGDIYTYELVNSFKQDANNAIVIVLFFETSTDKLFKVYYLVAQNGVKVGCYLYPETQ